MGETTTDVDLYEEEKSDSGFTVEKMAGVGLVSAILSMTLYYVYTQLGSDSQKAIKDFVSSAIHSFSERK
ncbi:MAG: hypothetical protein HYU64_10770 [Armatimonadetes bacterium]|nr:hypothetical protein [Armatimonadota bacterium]